MHSGHDALMQTPSPQSRPLRSQPTRDRILAAARDCFSERGFERTTIRVIAAAADVAPAMVIRYYGSKEELFTAAAHIDLRLPNLRDGMRDGVGEKLVSHFLDRWEGERSDGQLQALLRASISHTGANNALTEIFKKQLCATIEKIGVDQPELRAALIASQMLGLALVRYVLLLPGLANLSPAGIVSLIAPTVQSYLDNPLPNQI